MSYVRYSDGELGCGCANNEADRAGIPEDVSFIKSLLNLNVYDVFDKLETFENSVFINSLRASLALALSYRLINEGNELKGEGYDVEAFSAPNTPLLNPSQFVKTADSVAMVGFHMTASPLEA
jgi:hypothetical protein